jgi:MFS family permease
MTPVKPLHRSWIVVISSMVILATHSLTFTSFGIFLKPVTTQFGWERGPFSVAISITMLVGGAVGIFTGRLSDRHGPRLLVTASGILSGAGFMLMSQIDTLWQVYLIFGFFIALGASSRVVPILSTIPRWFATRRGAAMGLTFTGMAIGSTVGPVLAQSIISAHGWRTAYMVFGLINLALIPLLAQVLRRDPQQVGMRPYGESQAREEDMAAVPEAGVSVRQAVRTRRFWFLGALLFCVFFIHQVMMGHLAPHAIDIDIAPAAAATIVSVMGAANLVGRNVAGFMSDRIGARSYFSICLFAMTLALAWLLFTGDLWTLYLFVVVYGVAQGGVPVSQTMVVGDLFGLRYLGVIMASTMVMGSMGGSLGAPLAGSIYDSDGTYRLAFVICLVLGALAFAFSLLLRRAGRRR